ncbi:GNAT family N-acetyltransferase [Macrococcus animalis]|uniref:GNAT family N-acetyltransferase n=1 Tax=Macrococcus animalis TaxID=3395467 RepID=UPI0039BEB685
MNEIQYMTQVSLEDYQQLVEVYHSVGWMGHDLIKVEQVFNNSTHMIVAKDKESIIGFARALSDGVFNAAIYDVVVHPNYQGHGIARNLVQQLLDQFESLSCIHLISTTGNEEFYKRLGFKKLTTAMAVYHKENLETEYTE